MKTATLRQRTFLSIIFLLTCTTACSDANYGEARRGTSPGLPLPAPTCISDDDCQVDEICTPAGCQAESSNETDASPADSGAADSHCDIGDVQPCGSDVGACQGGTQTCGEEGWGPCIGGVGPSPEQCNGVDDDCDGVLPPEELDEDGDGVTACDGDCDDSNPEVSPDGQEICDGKTTTATP